MNLIFYISGIIAVACAIRSMTHTNAVHALLYLIVALLALALIFFLMGAPFAAVLEVIVYAGAIMVLFVFVIMMLNVAPEAGPGLRRWLRPGVWIGPGLLAAVLLGELMYVLTASGMSNVASNPVGPKAVGLRMFGPYILGVELASIMLLAGLVGAYHLARPQAPADTKGGA